jgi:hypothetical protein
VRRIAHQNKHPLVAKKTLKIVDKRGNNKMKKKHFNKILQANKKEHIKWLEKSVVENSQAENSQEEISQVENIQAENSQAENSQEKIS